MTIPLRLIFYAQGGTPTSESEAAGPGDSAGCLGAVSQVEDRLDPDATTWTETWAEVVQNAPMDADSLIVIAPRISRETIRRLQDHDSALLPVVVVTEEPLKAAHRLRRVEVHGIVDGDPETISRAVRKAAGGAVFERVARVAEEHPRLSPLLREWIAKTLRASPPYTSVEGSLRGVVATSDTLRRHWRQRIGILAPKRWLSHVQLTQARAHHLTGGDWHDIAEKMGIRVRTLQRLSARLTGVTLKELEGKRTWQEDFDRLATAVLSGGRPDN